MTTNPAAAMRMLITYAICIPIAIFVGYLLTNPLDYGSLGFLGFVMLVLITPILIKYHYEILLFSLASPVVLFFIIMRPPLGQAMVALSLLIAIIERALNSERRFMSVPSMTWPMIFLLGVVLLTMELTGGIGFHSFGSSGGGGRKYIGVFVSIATYFALTSRPIPTGKRNLFIALFLLAGLPSFVSDLFPYLPAPLNYINLLIPPSMQVNSDTLGSVETSIGRFGQLSNTLSILAFFMMAKWGLRGIFMGNRPWRAPVFLLFSAMTLVGGFRSAAIVFVMMVGFLFIFEGLYRTRLLMVFVFGGMLAGGLLVPLSDKLPLNIQRSLTFLPLNWDSEAVLQAQGSSEWRLRMWHDLWPKVPDYLLLGKGYSLTAEDYQEMGTGVFVNAGASMDSSRESLAISGDYHNGPLSTLIPFGLWGGIGFLWITAAGFRVLYRNYKYGPPELRTVNTFFLAHYTMRVVTFFAIFGAFHDDVGNFVRDVGFSIALNGGLLGPQPKPVMVSRIKPLPLPQAA